jgi:hypothetical protein
VKTDLGTDEPRTEPIRGDMAGDLQGLSAREDSNSESVAELVNEGQDLEGEKIEAIEDAPIPEAGALSSKEPPTRGPRRFRDRSRI